MTTKNNVPGLLYKGSKLMDGINYNMEITMLNGKITLLATSLSNPETITIQIPKDKSISI